LFALSALKNLIKHDSSHERLRRFHEQGKHHYLACPGYESSLIKRCIAQRGLNVDYIKVSSNGIPEVVKVGPHEIVMGIPKPLVLSTEEEIRLHVLAVHPMRIGATEAEAKATIRARRVLSRKLHAQRRRGIGVIGHDLGYIGGRTKNKRVMACQRESYKVRTKSQDKWLASMLFQGRNGESFALPSVEKVAEKRYGEFLCIAGGVRSYCLSRDLQSASVVVTLPPSAHPNPKHGTSTWNGILPDESNGILNHRWKLVRARLKKKDITLIGFRTTESHEDGCPHSNFVIYFPKEYLPIVEATFRSVFGVSENTVRFTAHSSIQDCIAAGLYASKFLNPHNQTEAHQRAMLGEQTWAGTWGIRRIQWFGIPQLRVWRDLRASGITPEDPRMAQVWRAARGGRFDKYIGLQGGIGIPLGARPFRSTYEVNATGKSVTAIGVLNTTSGFHFQIRNAGYWTLSATDESISEKKVTVAINKPSLRFRSYENDPKLQIGIQRRLFLPADQMIIPVNRLALRDSTVTQPEWIATPILSTKHDVLHTKRDVIDEKYDFFNLKRNIYNEKNHVLYTF
jgi:hypothetical protein